MPEPVIREMAAALSHRTFGPSRAEGFAAVVGLDPSQARELEALLRDELDASTNASASRQQEPARRTASSCTATRACWIWSGCCI